MNLPHLKRKTFHLGLGMAHPEDWTTDSKSSSLANPMSMSATNSSQTMVRLSWVCYTLLRKLLEIASSGSCLTVGFWKRWAWDKDLKAGGLPGRWAQKVGMRKQEERAGERGKVSPVSPCWRQLGLDFTGSCEPDKGFLLELSRKEEGMGLCHQFLSSMVGVFWIWAELSYLLEKDPRQKTREPWTVLLKVKCHLCDSELTMGWSPPQQRAWRWARGCDASH